MGRFLLVLLALAATLVPKTSAAEKSRDYVLNADKIHNLIVEKKVKTIEELLSYLGPKIMRHNVLVYDSRSLQKAEWMRPRVIVHNNFGQFIMAFNDAARTEEEKKDSGRYALEMIDYNLESDAFDFKTIHFDPKGKEDPVYVRQPDCTGCHGQPTRPNWDPYFHWVGVYGSEDDNENADYNNPPPGVIVNDDIGSGHIKQIQDSPEIRTWNAFKRKRDQQIIDKRGRYRFVPDNPMPRPVGEFNDYIVRLNIRRIMARFTRHKKAKKLLPLFRKMKESNYVESMWDHIPEDERINLKFSTYEQYEHDTIKQMNRAVAFRIKRHIRVHGPPVGRVRSLDPTKLPDEGAGYHKHDDTVARIFFESLLGFDYNNLSTSFGIKDYDLNLGFQSAFNAEFKALKIVDGWPKMVNSPKSFNYIEGYGYEIPHGEYEPLFDKYLEKYRLFEMGLDPDDEEYEKHSGFEFKTDPRRIFGRFRRGLAVW